MASLIESNRSAEVPVLDVTLGGRRFPARWDELPETAYAAPLPLHEASPEMELVERFKEAIRQRVMGDMKPSDDERTAIVEVYVQSIAELERCRAEVVPMIRAACEANIEFRQAAGETHATARDKTLRSVLDEMLNPIGELAAPPRNIADANLVSQPVAILRETFQAAMETAVAQFAQEFFAMLARGVDRQLFGLVEWLPHQCCRYHFFRQVLIQESRVQSNVAQATFFSGTRSRDPFTGERIIGKRTHHTEHRGQHHRRLARHQHDVMNAVRTSIGNSRVVMPPAVVHLIESIPVWLRPLVQVIDGEIFRERIVERNLRTEHWSEVDVRDEPITIRDEPLFGREPGVIIGPYVLTGWGPQEVEAELERRRQAEEQAAKQARVAAAGWQAPLYFGAAVLLTLITLGFYRPFAIASEYAAKVDSVTLYLKGGTDQLVGELVKQQGAFGDAAADALGLDLIG